jgi:hypothetical protein
MWEKKVKRREEMGKGSEEGKELTQAHPLLHDHITTKVGTDL